MGTWSTLTLTFTHSDRAILESLVPLLENLQLDMPGFKDDGSLESHTDGTGIGYESEPSAGYSPPTLEVFNNEDVLKNLQDLNAAQALLPAKGKYDEPKLDFRKLTAEIKGLKLEIYNESEYQGDVENLWLEDGRVTKKLISAMVEVDGEPAQKAQSE